MKNIFLFVAALAMLQASVPARSSEYFGTYSGSVKVAWDKEPEYMTLLEDFEFKDPNDMKWVAKKGQKTNGASIPRALWSIVGSPYTGAYRDAAVIHDIACMERQRTWETVHLAFYYAMRASGVEALRAKAMYAAVHHFGPRWPITKKIEVQPARKQLEVVPATYQVLSTRVQVVEPRREWRKDVEVAGLPVINRHRSAATGEELVEVEVPATYRTVTKRVVAEPATTREIEIPATYQMVEVNPLKRQLSESDFKRLVKKLESTEPAKSELSLDEIRNFK